ncbi:tetratricopeptide repeat protein [Aquirufa sp. A-Brett2-15D]
MKRVLLLCLISFASITAFSQTKPPAGTKAVAPVKPVRAAKYEVLYGSKPLSKADQKELNEFVASCDASFGSRAEAVTFFAERAWEYVASARLDTATYRFNLISALDANSVDAFWGLGVISYQRGDNDLAIRLLNKGLEIDSTVTMMRVDYAIVKLDCYQKGIDCGTLDEVEAELVHALQQDPKNASAWMKRCQVAYYKENYELAWTYFHEARVADILQLDLNFGALLEAKMPDPKGIFK